MSSIAQVTNDRARAAVRLIIEDGVTSQWIHAGPFRSCYCAATQSTPSRWSIEGQLPNGQTVELGNYDQGNLFNPTMPRYITVNAMCGLPIRFVATTPQINPQLWAILKS